MQTFTLKKVVGSDTVLLAVHHQHPFKSTAVHLNCFKEVACYSWRDGSVGEVQACVFGRFLSLQ